LLPLFEKDSTPPVPVASKSQMHAPSTSTINSLDTNVARVAMVPWVNIGSEPVVRMPMVAIQTAVLCASDMRADDTLTSFQGWPSKTADFHVAVRVTDIYRDRDAADTIQVSSPQAPSFVDGSPMPEVYP